MHPDEDLLTQEALGLWQDVERLEARAVKINMEITDVLITINLRTGQHEERLGQGQAVTREEREQLAELRRLAQDLQVFKRNLPALIDKARSQWLRRAASDVEAAWRDDAARLAEITREVQKGPVAKQLKAALPEVRRIAEDTVRRINLIGLTVSDAPARMIGGLGWCLPLGPPATPDDLLRWLICTPRYAALLTRNGTGHD